MHAYSDALAQQEAVIAGLRAKLAAERARSAALQEQCEALQEASEQQREALVGVQGQDAQCLCGRLLASNAELARENAQLIKSNSQLRAGWDAEASQNWLMLQQPQLQAAQFEAARLQRAACEELDAMCDESGWSQDLELV